MSFPISPTEGQEYKDYIYEGGMWNNIIGERFIPFHESQHSTSAPVWQINSVALSTTEYMSPEFPMIPVGAKRVKLRTYITSYQTNTEGSYYFELKASDDTTPFPWSGAVGCTGVVLNKNEHYTLDVPLGADKKVKAYINGSGISSVSVHSHPVGWWI